MSISSRENLIASTKQFFERHWCLDDVCPTWDFSWQWRGAMPNYDRGGVYALFASDELAALNA
ncbi:hypothetical protein AGMMS49545_24170 [Betaproteobacteria bacterium]|nr:hypothetical protein AGMMS49545_24170 [Betaproteobacteria bacterium]GHU49765.1 hypothetical protein AGMMS50289_26700 [Betaproteobacteria bacterium]